MDAIRVVLADNYPIVRFGIRSLLEQNPDFLITGEAGDGDEALHLALALAPDVLVLETKLPGMVGLEVVRRLCASESSVRVLAFSISDDEQTIAGLMEYGAYGYLTKDEAVERLVDAIRGAARGETGWLSRRAAARLAHHHVREANAERLTMLSARERQVLRLVARGFDNLRIAAELSIAEGTVKNHITNINTHLDVRSRVESVVWAWQQGLINQGNGGE